MNIEPIVADLPAFLTVARERSFTRAAAAMGISQSALSHRMKAMEQRLGLRLLDRTTRSVALTEAGKRLLDMAGPHLREIEHALQELNAFRTRPAGAIRINSSEHALRTVIWPFVARFARQYPDIRIELDADNGLIDIVERGYDAGVRLGEQVARDMIATRIAPDWRMAVVAAPAYLAANPAPATPDDLTAHNCINLRLITSGGFYPWEFEKSGRRLNVRVEGQLAFNSSLLGLEAAVAGLGLACVPEEAAEAHIAAGSLIQVLADWMPTFAGYHLYYPSRQHSAAFRLFVEGIRYRP
ncbi:MAG: LysR family transcriptional regulator [Candidatus Devosia phytovorans]|uniref:LysR family transcriptional regulator n=1 Tax=Candidatus Devosia phytovorans TaxID=3121372 RepID=A0AAJ5VXN9_9HYPH|nr:LysR family transcriptional regulator [Devosia sp.]WEK05372.1 MAG: LysR family transcriptional regulator [Devosia sp.]